MKKKNKGFISQLKFKNIKVIFVPKYDAMVENNNGKKIILNSNDIALLISCSKQEKWVSEIARELNISTKNVSVRLLKLKNFGLISINSYDCNWNKKYIKTLIKIPDELKIRGRK